MLYYVRPNAILFLIGFLLMAYFVHRNYKTRVKSALMGCGLFFLTISPWLIRNIIEFQNPFHLAGSAGLLRAEDNDPHTYGIVEFLKLHGTYPVKAVFFGFFKFFKILNFYEHYLEILPLVFCVFGFYRKKIFYSLYVTTGFLLTFAICCYISYRDWGGIRYYSSFMPFLYGYGVFQFVSVSDKIFSGIPFMKKYYKTASLIAVLAFCLLPVINAHRFYERKFSNPVEKKPEISAYLNALSEQISGKNTYMSGSLAQINFLTGLNCVGMSHLFDSTSVRDIMHDFQPSLIVLTPEEAAKPKFQAIIRSVKNQGYNVNEKFSNTMAVFYSISAI